MELFALTRYAAADMISRRAQAEAVHGSWPVVVCSPLRAFSPPMVRVESRIRDPLRTLKLSLHLFFGRQSEQALRLLEPGLQRTWVPTNASSVDDLPRSGSTA